MSDHFEENFINFDTYWDDEKELFMDNEGNVIEDADIMGSWTDEEDSDDDDVISVVYYENAVIIPPYTDIDGSAIAPPQDCEIDTFAVAWVTKGC